MTSPRPLFVLVATAALTLTLLTPPSVTAHDDTLAEGSWSGGNPVPPNPLGFEVTIISFDVPAGLARMDAHFERTHHSIELFAPNARLYAPDGTLGDQAAFSDAQYGNFQSSGTADLVVLEPTPGTWRAVYLNDGLDPTGTHSVAVVVTGA